MSANVLRVDQRWSAGDLYVRLLVDGPATAEQVTGLADVVTAVDAWLPAAASGEGSEPMADGVEVMYATIKVRLLVTSGRADGHNPMIPVRDALAERCRFLAFNCGEQKARVLSIEEVEVRRG